MRGKVSLKRFKKSPVRFANENASFDRVILKKPECIEKASNVICTSFCIFDKVFHLFIAGKILFAIS